MDRGMKLSPVLHNGGTFTLCNHNIVWANDGMNWINKLCNWDYVCLLDKNSGNDILQ